MESLNARAARLVMKLIDESDKLRLRVEEIPGGGRVIDAGVDAPGGIHAGLLLAMVAMADLAEVSILTTDHLGPSVPVVQVTTDHPTAACMASQYAGWSISVGKYFAMGSGPMRAAYGGEPLFDSIGRREQPSEVVGVLESRTIPTAEVLQFISEKTRVSPGAITLLVAPTASLAGGVQVVARSIETALHKLQELHFDLERVVAGHGTAPLPPVAVDDLAAIGRTNDCVLYGAQVTLWVKGDDQSILDLGPRVPSSASPDHGAPFAEIFERYDHDFYKIDPGLFSPAEILFQNVDTGRTHRFGKTEPEVLRRSLFS